jgi:hypothetical protein
MLPENNKAEPTLQDCARRLLEIETYYNVSLKVWMSLDGDGYDQLWWNVHVAGGGAAFDNMPDRLGHCKARVVSAFESPIGAAMWHCLDRLSQALYRYQGGQT